MRQAFLGPPRQGEIAILTVWEPIGTRRPLVVNEPARKHQSLDLNAGPAAPGHKLMRPLQILEIARNVPLPLIGCYVFGRTTYLGDITEATNLSGYWDNAAGCAITNLT